MDTLNTFATGKTGKLAVRMKRPKGAIRNAIVLVQGSNVSGQTMFDFQYDDYSVMDALAAAGYAVVTFAVRGYGASDVPPDPRAVGTDAAIEDLAAVMDWTRGQGYTRPHLLGFSWGGRIAGRYAEQNPGRIDRLILDDPARGGGALITPAPTDPWWINTPQSYTEKLEPQFTDMVMLKAFTDHVTAVDHRAPSGIRVENATPYAPIDPERITNPTLLIYGVEAGKAAYMHGGTTRADFFEKLKTDDKAFVILPEGGDFIHLQKGRHRFHRAILQFLA